MNVAKPNVGGSSRPAARASWLALVPMVGVLTLPRACDTTRTEVQVDQPIDFSHRTHEEYFSSGDHRAGSIQFHMVEFEYEEDEDPDDLDLQECATCHDMWEKPRCFGCHELYQNEDLRNRSEIMSCVGCHRQAWTGYRAGIPSIEMCRTCHGEGPRGDDPEEDVLRGFLARGEDVPWSRLHNLAPHTHFSHKAHVRYAGLECTTCHEDMRDKDSPPTTVTVFSMEGCVRCHEENQAPNDCLTCHK